MMMMKQEQKELFALAAWLQTFPDFDVPILYSDESEGPADAERLVSVLHTTEATLAVSKVAETICEVTVDSALAKSPRESSSSRSGTDMIWNSLLIMSSARARPAPNNNNNNQNDESSQQQHPSNLKLAVLGNLLDCAVQAPDKQQRRTYIGRIMGLKKASQKTIMAMIESRAAAAAAHRSPHNKRNTPTTTAAAAPPSAKVAAPAPPSTTPSTRSPPPAAVANNKLTPPRSSYTGVASTPPKPQQQQPMGLFPPPTAASSSSSAKSPAQDAMSLINCTGVGPAKSEGGSSGADVAATRPQPAPSTTSLSPTKSSLKKGDTPNRGYSVAFGSPMASSPSCFTPDHRRHFLGGGGGTDGSGGTANPGFLSPGTLESPDRMQSIVTNLQRKNEFLQQVLDGFQCREEELKQKLEAMESNHRQKMIKVEAQSLDRIQDMQREAEERAAELHAQLAEAQEQARQGASAMHELKAAKEELEVMNHSRSALAETTEKLRKYKDKVTELQDVKEALRKEQEAHGQSVDELVRLENELQQLQPVKRQVEDYKIRAIEAEVKLVECQDYLRRMERQANDQNAKNEYLYKGVVMQKEQMEEMQRRIQEDTQQAMESMGSVNGVGDGISELNPALKEELVRLRNENLQLRAFQAKRTEDAVQCMEESLDDARRLADRYKNEYLDNKDTLGATQATLAETQHSEANLRREVKQWQDRCHETEKHCEVLKEQLDRCEQQLEQTKISQEDAEDSNAKLHEEVEDWMRKKQDSDAVSEERMKKLEETLQELSNTKDILRSAEAAVEQLQGDVEGLEADAEENAQSFREMEGNLRKTTWELEDTRNRLADRRNKVEALEGQVMKLQKELRDLEDKLDLERSQRKEEAEEGQRSLETTRELLETKNRKEQEDLQANMARLLDDERKAYRIKDEEANRMYQHLEQECQEKYLELQERSTSLLRHSRQENQERINFIKEEYEEDLAKLTKENSERIDLIKKEHEEDVAKLTKENSETQDTFIRKGKKLLDICKSDARNAIQELEDKCRDLEEKNARLDNDMAERDRLLRGKIASMNQQLMFTTSQVNDRTREADEYVDQIKMLEREKFKLSEENEQYRRQLGGRYGADGLVQSQLEKLQKEYSAVVDENRNLKKQFQHGNAGGLLDSIVESGEEGEDVSRSYRRGGGIDRRALTQLRQEYEERIEVLNDEKRDLIMRMSSQSTDVHKAEKRAWEREEENAKLKADNTSLKLKLQRAEFGLEMSDGTMVPSENRSPTETSFHSTDQGASSPIPAKSTSPGKLLIHSSPGIDRAKKQKLAQENLLRNRFSSMAAPPRKVLQLAVAIETSTAIVPSTGNVLSPSNKHKHHPNYDQLSSGTEMPLVPSRPPSPTKSPVESSSISMMASDVFRLGTNPESPRSKSNAMPYPQSRNAPSIMQYTQLHEQQGSDSQPECKQS